MKKDDLKVYCKFNKDKETVDKIIYKIFKDYSENKNIELKSRQNEKDTLK